MRRRTGMKREAFGNCLWLLPLPSHFLPFLLPFMFVLLNWAAFLETPLLLSASSIHLPCTYSPLNLSGTSGATCSILSSILPLTCQANMLGRKKIHNYWSLIAKLLKCNLYLKCSLPQSSATPSSFKSIHILMGFISRSPQGPTPTNSKLVFRSASAIGIHYVCITNCMLQCWSPTYSI